MDLKTLYGLDSHAAAHREPRPPKQLTLAALAVRPPAAVAWRPAAPAPAAVELKASPAPVAAPAVPARPPAVPAAARHRRAGPARGPRLPGRGEGAERRGDVARVQRRRRHLIEQRLEQVVVVTIQQHYIQAAAGQWIEADLTADAFDTYLIIASPSGYDPINNPEPSRRRFAQVTERLAKVGLLTQDEADDLAALVLRASMQRGEPSGPS